MSFIEETKKYATEVASAALNAFEQQARGDLEAPNGDDNVRLYTAKGGSAVTLASTTTSASVIYDPESSLRNGQLNVVVYGRNSAGTVTEEQHVNLGRPTSEFLSVGCLSSGLKVFNSSGVDVIGGTQTAAVLTSIPRDVATISSTDVANACASHDRDMASGVVSREDSTLTIAMTEHFGKKMALSRSNTTSNVVSRKWDDAVGSRRTTSGQTLGFTADTDMTVGTTDLTSAQILAGDQTKFIVDTDRLDSANNPLTLATYNVEASAYIEMSTVAVNNNGQTYDAMLIALDAAGNVLDTSTIRDRGSTSTGAVFDMVFSGSVSSSTVPIHRVVMSVFKSSQAMDDVIAAAQSVAVVTAREETADIAARPIHVCVLEGLNASATLNLSSTAVLTGVPDSTNVFIGSAQEAPRVFDTNAVEVFLKSVSRVLPRAFTVSGHRAVTHEIKAFYEGEEVDMSFKAMSFKPIAEGIKKIGKVAKGMTPEIEMALRGAGSMLSPMPGVAGVAGRGMLAGAEVARRI
uniref:Uncharacterized protein n=1 Tax=viral metagenome TaxID=1070528 RepID=A0A2V0R948_9ZZZZ